MRDLLLWKLLQEDPLNPSPIIPLLHELQQRPVQQRVPFLGLLPRCLEHADPQLRAAAVACLGDVSGHVGFRQIIKALDDSEEIVRLTAVRALRHACRYDGPRFAHALFHPDPGIRREAVDPKEPWPVPAWYGLYLLPDPETAPLLKGRLDPSSSTVQVIPLLLNYYRQGLLSAAEVRPWLMQISWSSHFNLFSSGQQRTQEVFQALLNRARAANFPGTLGDVGEDVLDLLFDLLWEEPAAPGPEEPSTQKFFLNLRNFLQHHAAIETEQRILASLAVTAVRRGGWNPHAAEVMMLFHPWFLDFAWVPAAVRRAAVAVFYNSGSFPPKDSKTIRDELLKLPLCRRPTGNLDLWVIGGLLHLVPSEPIKHLLKWCGENAVITAFVEDIEDSAPLLSLRDNSDRGVNYLLEQITAARRADAIKLIVLLVQARPANELHFLDRISGTDAVTVFTKVVKGGRQPGMSLSENKLQKLAGHLGERILTGAQAEFVRTLLGLPKPEESQLALFLLGHLAQRLTPEQFWDLGRDLAVGPLLKFLHLIAASAGIPYATEVFIARELRAHDDDEIRAWTTCRLPAEYLERLSDKAPNPWGVLKLTASQADQIASCSEANLPAALADWLGQPSRGLCAALARRPASPSRPACLALLGCHDPLGQVEAQFERFYLDTPASLQRLEADAVTVWRTCKHLPLVGRTWLHRWEEHCWALPDSFRKMPDDMLQALSNTRTFKSALLGRRLWEAVDHLVGLWHWHDRARVEGGGGVSPLQGTIPPVHPAADARDRPQAPRDLWLGNRTALPVRPGFAAGQGRG